MQTDRELLELAAKAIGVKAVCGRACEGIEGRLLHHMGAGLLCMNDLYWNPLADDGDALRLAVLLNIPIIPYDDETSTGTVGVVATNWGSKEANTRRAIVCAAAAMAERWVLASA